MFLVDTNILVYACVPDVPEHAACKRLVDEWRTSRLPWRTTWGVLYEFMRVVTHPRVLRIPMKFAVAVKFVHALHASSSFGVLDHTSRHSELLAELAREVQLLSGNIVHDAHNVVLMREHGLRRIYTRDGDYHKFPGLEVIDPLRP